MGDSRAGPPGPRFDQSLGFVHPVARLVRCHINVRAVKKVVEMHSNSANVHGDMAAVYLYTGKYNLWIQESETEYNLSHQPEYEAVVKEVGKVYAQSGSQAALREWAKQMVELSKRRYEDPGRIGFIYAKAGDKDQAFAWLEKGLKEKSDATQYLKTNHLADSLRSDPRYREMLKQMGLPQ